MQPSSEIGRLLEIMAALRTPQTGCPWDLEQTSTSIVPYTIEEAYEVADAVAQGDPEDVKDELGDLLLQVVFLSRIAEENGSFAFGDVVEAITRKLIRRHPHVFGDTRDLSPAAVKNLWAEIKAAERAEKAARHPQRAQPPKHLAGVPVALPGLTRAVKLQQKAASVGFDWPEIAPVMAKIREETEEIEAALAAQDREGIAEEIGDLLFAVANLARHAEIDAEAAIRASNAKFERRFGYIEESLAARGTSLAQAGLTEMDALWTDAKQQER